MKKQTNKNNQPGAQPGSGSSGFTPYDANFKIIGHSDPTTIEQYDPFQNAYNYFREHLFGNALPAVILTLNRSVKAMGYYKPYAWTDCHHHTIPEISINPEISQLPPIEIMQTLVHEMCHLCQHIVGKPGKRGYHNREFSHLMFSVGLMTSSTGRPGGKVTGRRMSDYLITGGLFEEKFYEMPKEFLLPFISPNAIERPPVVPIQEKELADKNKTKYACRKCTTVVWGKPNLELECRPCKSILVVVTNSKTKKYL